MSRRRTSEIGPRELTHFIAESCNWAHLDAPGRRLTGRTGLGHHLKPHLLAWRDARPHSRLAIRDPQDLCGPHVRRRGRRPVCPAGRRSHRVARADRRRRITARRHDSGGGDRRGGHGGRANAAGARPVDPRKPGAENRVCHAAGDGRPGADGPGAGARWPLAATKGRRVRRGDQPSATMDAGAPAPVYLGAAFVKAATGKIGSNWAPWPGWLSGVIEDRMPRSIPLYGHFLSAVVSCRTSHLLQSRSGACGEVAVGCLLIAGPRDARRRDRRRPSHSELLAAQWRDPALARARRHLHVRQQRPRIRPGLHHALCRRRGPRPGRRPDPAPTVPQASVLLDATSPPIAAARTRESRHAGSTGAPAACRCARWS